MNEVSFSSTSYLQKLYRSTKGFFLSHFSTSIESTEVIIFHNKFAIVFEAALWGFFLLRVCQRNGTVSHSLPTSL